ncbi:MAG: HAD hydrolase-like protein, partial [Candidatus Staskawiczbacteria bacterium]|nr:HAD hydrolase-like protein [Candidatus Staskawiczbacteria bacterium]
MIKAVIFDMDGLMIDSEILHFEAYKNTVLKYGAVFDIEDYLPYFGMTDKKVSNDLVKKFKLPVSQKELLLQKNKIF